MHTYRVAGDGTAIKCLRCGRTSFDPKDVVNLRCPLCGYHDFSPKRYLERRLREKADAAVPRPEKPP